MSSHPESFDSAKAPGAEKPARGAQSRKRRVRLGVESESSPAQDPKAARRAGAKQKSLMEQIEWEQESAYDVRNNQRDLILFRYEKGHVIEQDECPIRRLEEAAQEGDTDALAQLGRCYYGGYHLPRDLARAREYLEQAAQRGHAEALYDLGLMYLNGDGVPRHRAFAYELFQMAAEHEYGLAFYRIAKGQRCGVGLRKNHRLSAANFRHAQELGVPGLGYHLFLMSDRSVGLRTWVIAGIVVALFAAGWALERSMPEGTGALLFGFLAVLLPLPKLLEAYVELRVNGLRLQYGIVDLWCGLLGFLPAAWMASVQIPAALAHRPNALSPLFAVGLTVYLFIALGLAFLWGALTTRISGTAQRSPWRARIHTLAIQLLISAFLLLLLLGDR